MAGTGILMKTSSVSAQKKHCSESAWIHLLIVHNKSYFLGSMSSVNLSSHCSARRVPTASQKVTEKGGKAGER